jgi:hypothetical protein
MSSRFGKKMTGGGMNSNSTDKGQIRKFGAAAMLLFGVLLVPAIWREWAVLTILFTILSTTGAALLLLPGHLAPVYRGWITIAHVISQVFTVILLTLAYYLVITPAALLKRLIGGRPLPLKPDPRLTSYWVERNEPVQPRERFEKRF